MKTVITLFQEEREGEYGFVQRPTLGTFLREARLQKGLTQEELAERCGTTKAYISKVENNAKDIRFATLQKLVETGLDGQLNVSITL